MKIYVFLGDFNYFSNLKFEPSHELCLSVYNGYNPMNVSINSWYQVFNHLTIFSQITHICSVLAPVVFRMDGKISLEPNGTELANQ